jgi:hypothetical protein
MVAASQVGPIDRRMLHSPPYQFGTQFLCISSNRIADEFVLVRPIGGDLIANIIVKPQKTFVI